MSISKYIYKGEYLWLPVLYQDHYGKVTSKTEKLNSLYFPNLVC